MNYTITLLKTSIESKSLHFKYGASKAFITANNVN